MQACNGKGGTDFEKRSLAHEVKGLVKKLDKTYPWPFEYIRQYPRSPFELPDTVLNHACGHGVRPVAPPAEISDPAFSLLVTTTPYKKSQASRLSQTTPAE